METSGRAKLFCEMSSGNVEVNLEAFNRADDSARIPDRELNTHNSLDEQNLYSDELPNTEKDKRKDRIRRRMLHITVVISLLVIAVSVGIIVFLLLSSESEDSDDCTSSHCGNGTCIGSINNYTCACNPGFTGTRCERDSDDCTSSHCGNGTCIGSINNYTCACNPRFTGKRCERDIDECTSIDCGNGSCIDGINNYTCACTLGFTGKSCERVLTDCYDLYHFAGHTFDGVYTIVTWKTHQNIKVYCDMTTDGGGWTVFQYRFNGSLDFYRNFTEYKHGFGNLNSEFWLGLNYIQEISSQGQTDLRISLESANGTRAFEQFENFYLSPGPDFTLHLGRPTDSSST